MKKNKKAFTLAEVLITLGIIGVVAAMTLPVLVANYQKQATVAKLKKVYSILNQAYKMSESENGFSEEWGNEIQEINTENVQKYVQRYWLPYLKVIGECSKSGDCSYPDNVMALDKNPDGTVDLVGNNRYTLILADGTLIAFVPFSWDGKNQIINGDQKFYVDINGAQRPNMLGKDVFIFELNANKHAICAVGQDNSTENLNKVCNKNSNGWFCAAKIIHDGWEIKKDYPW